MLESLELEVSQNGRVAAIGTVSTQAQSTLFEVFGPDNKVEITSSQHLFDIPPSEQQQIVTQQSGLMDLRVRARVVRGEEAFDDHGHGVEPLDRYTGTNRYGSHRDGEGDPEGDKGGDDWARALVVDAITHFSSTVNGFTVNDFSNMHGGRFPDHDSHQTGRDVDFRFPG